MCGIAGIVNKRGFEPYQIQEFTQIIRHRGPDDEGYFLVDTKNEMHIYGGNDTPDSVWLSDKHYSPTGKLKDLKELTVKLAFGHRRLSILDLSPAGHQPMSYQNKRYWITFNGEIYNYLDLKVELQHLGYQFITRTDTEVVLAAYAEWGQDCLSRFAGMWAFAIYDHYLKEIFVARDRYGIKPLYYWFSPEGNFYFASEIKQFTVCQGWVAHLEPQKAYDYLVYSMTDHTDETMFTQVYHLPAGSCFKSELGSIRADHTGRIYHHKWYLLNRSPFSGSFIEASEQFKLLFERSVEEHLNADVPVGTALSGGLDSSAIVCEVNRLLRLNKKPEMQKTFSSCSYDERFNEKKWMDIVVGHTKVNAHFIYPGFDDLVEDTDSILWYQDEPYQSQSTLLAYKVFELTSNSNVKVLLNGQGADEYLGGYGQFTNARYASLVKRFELGSLFCDIKNMRRIRHISSFSLFKGIIYHLLPTILTRGISTISNSSDYVRELIDINKLKCKGNHPYSEIPVNYRNVHEISEHQTFYSTLPKYLRWEDRNSMAHSIEARVPFLDHRLVEFSFNLPDEFLERDGITKRIMRQALRDLLPEKIQSRQDKMGFTTPEELWVKVENPGFFRDKLREAITYTNGIIKSSALTYYDNMVLGRVPFDYTYWRIILFYEWLKRYKVKI